MAGGQLQRDRAASLPDGAPDGSRGSRPARRLWFEAGTRDESADRDGDGVIDAIQDTRELIDKLEAKGFRRGTDLAYRQMEDGEHHEATWARALPELFRWALPPRRN